MALTLALTDLRLIHYQVGGQLGAGALLASLRNERQQLENRHHSLDQGIRQLSNQFDNRGGYGGGQGGSSSSSSWSQQSSGSQGGRSWSSSSSSHSSWSSSSSSSGRWVNVYFSVNTNILIILLCSMLIRFI